MTKMGTNVILRRLLEQSFEYKKLWTLYKNEHKPYEYYGHGM
jgi:hypothetical protein